MIPTIATRNFNLEEVIHQPAQLLADPNQAELIQIGLIAMGYVQSLRDALCEKFQKDIRLEICSGFRNKQYNASVGGSPTSYHMWRFDKTAPGKGKVIFALDIKSPDLSSKQLFDAVKDFVKGETEHRPKLKYVHFAPSGVDQEWEQ